MRGSIAIALLGAMLTQVALAAGAPGTSWSSIARLPDWSRVWELDWHGGNLAKAALPGAPKLTAEYAARLEKYRGAQQQGENQQTDTANCDPPQPRDGPGRGFLLFLLQLPRARQV